MMDIIARAIALKLATQYGHSSDQAIKVAGKFFEYITKGTIPNG